MVTVLKYGSKKEAINRLLNRLHKQIEEKGIDAYKYSGVIDLLKDPLEIQSNRRDEWK